MYSSFWAADIGTWDVCARFQCATTMVLATIDKILVMYLCISVQTYAYPGAGRGLL